MGINNNNMKNLKTFLVTAKFIRYGVICKMKKQREFIIVSTTKEAAIHKFILWNTMQKDPIILTGLDAREIETIIA